MNAIPRRIEAASDSARSELDRVQKALSEAQDMIRFAVNTLTPFLESPYRKISDEQRKFEIACLHESLMEYAADKIDELSREAEEADLALGRAEDRDLRRSAPL